MYEELIKQLRHADEISADHMYLCSKIADAIESLSRDFAIVDDLNHDKDIEIEELKAELKEQAAIAAQKHMELFAELKQVKRERDAAVADLDRCCALCKHNEQDG